MPPPIWEALRRPSLGDRPPSSGAGWSQYRLQLQALAAATGAARHFRMWRSLWSLLRPDTAIPAGTAWRELCAQATVGDFAAAALAPAPRASGGFAGWNARWLVDPHTERSARKRARIAHEVLAGRPRAVQETHWRPAGREACVHAVPGATVVTSYAPAGRQGGVATWLPLGWSVQGELDAL